MADERNRDDAPDAEGYVAQTDSPDAAQSPTTPPADAGAAWNFRTPEEQRRHEEDPAYGSWRDARMDSFDQDYEAYRKEHPTGPESGFAEWRRNRANSAG